MYNLEETIKLNKFLIIRFIEDIINDIKTYDWHFNNEYRKSSKSKDESVSFMIDFIKVNYYMGNLQEYLYERYLKKFKSMLATPLDAFRGYRTTGFHPLYLMTEDIFFQL